mgnify:CR=1 FL=1
MVTRIRAGRFGLIGIAVALAELEKRGLPQNAIELQMLHGMADPLKEAAADRGLRLREYVPVGEMVPENASVNYNGETYFLSATEPGVFEYSFDKVRNPVEFSLSANGVVSRNYALEVIKVPRLLNFQMILDYPDYTRKENEVMDGSGNATVPEGTLVQWNLKTASTDVVSLILKDTSEAFIKSASDFSLKKMLMQDLDYEISTSNKDVTAYEKLHYSLEVVKDQFPRMELESAKDSVDLQTRLHEQLDLGAANALLLLFAIAQQCTTTIAVIHREHRGGSLSAVRRRLGGT